MTTITLTIQVDGATDDYEVSIKPKAKQLPTTDEWSVESALEYFKLLQPHVVVCFHSLLDADRSTEYLTKLVGFTDTSVLAGSLAWPGRFATQMGKKLPWSYDGHTVKLLPEVKPVFKEAIGIFTGA